MTTSDPPDPRRVLRHLRTVAAMQPDPATTARALAKTRQALAAIPVVKPDTRHRLFWRIIMPASLSAAAALVVGFFLLVGSNQRALAAEQLQQVAEANSKYQGWVHIQAEPPSGTTLPAGPDPLPSRVWEHMNTINGTTASVREYENWREIVLYLPARKETVTYDSRSGEIRQGDLDANTAKVMAEAAGLSPTSIGTFLAGFKKSMGRDPAEIRRTEEGGAERYDIELFKNEQEAQNFEKEHQLALPSKSTLWVDLKTKLIRKAQFTQGGMTMTAAFTYGPPEIRDIYDLDVPRATKVVDNRADASVVKLLDRLDRRAAAGLGNGVAVLTKAGLDRATGSLDPSGYVTLFAESEKSWLICEYGVNHPNRNVPKSDSLSTLPPGWPRPKLEDFLSRLQEAMPSTYFVVKDGKGWAGLYWQGPNPYPNARSVGAEERIPITRSTGLGGTIWPNRIGSNLMGTSAQVRLVSDAKRPGLVGLHVVHPADPRSSQTYSENEYWLDPAKDDVPVESTWRDYAPDQKTVTTEVRTEYLEYAQLPNGQWYPTHWRQTGTVVRPGRAATQPAKWVVELNLIVVPGMELGKEWFVNPAEKFGEKKPDSNTKE